MCVRGRGSTDLFGRSNEGDVRVHGLDRDLLDLHTGGDLLRSHTGDNNDRNDDNDNSAKMGAPMVRERGGER